MIFVSYSHEDRKFRDAFVRMAAPLKRYVRINAWSDVDIQAGKDWKKEINRAMDASSVAVLLVSEHFFHSDFIQDVELSYFMKARATRGLEIIWVLVSDCYVKGTPVSTVQAALDPSKPIEVLSPPQQRTAWKLVVEQVDEAWRQYERPQINGNLRGRTVKRRERNLPLLARPARRQTEVFVKPAGPGQFWWHQCSIPAGKTNGKCTFGNENTKQGHRFEIVAITTNQPISAKAARLPSHRARSEAVAVMRQ